MIIGLDVSVIQTPHRMRGIGATAINVINNIPQHVKANHKFILFMYSKEQDTALSILDLTGLDYEIREINEENRVALRLPGRLRVINGILTRLKNSLHSRLGDPRISNTSDLDVFLQFDQMQSLPVIKNAKTAVILYDLIPYIIESEYLWGYRTARKHHSRKGALRKALLRRQYISQARIVAKKAKVLYAISNHTKHDYSVYTSISPSKIKVMHLGINKFEALKPQKNVSFDKYIENSWGSFPQPTKLDDKPFLLFVGGADPRRKLNDLVGAYNNLKAQGHDIRLVLAGDTMKGPHAIPVAEVQNYVSSSSYLDDIVFLGFVTDAQREWLYSHALAFVYPSVYEGFGLPILEAMQYGTPVITYKNTSIYEIASDAALYADGILTIEKAVKELSSNPALKTKYEQLGPAQAAKFSWAQTSEKMFNDLLS